nr:MAG TPA: hypothetical protein [Caudoviricetes sp.]
MFIFLKPFLIHIFPPITSYAISTLFYIIILLEK